MKPLLNPKLDIVFKQLFTTDPDILLDLINVVLGFPEYQRIQSIEIKNPIILPEDITEKYIILDIKAVDTRKSLYDIEMQTQKYRYYPERIVYYLSRMYAIQLEAGESYEYLRPVIGIHFLDYEQFPKYAEWHFCFELRDVRYPKLRLTEQFLLHLFELPKFERVTQPEQWGEKMFEWLHFFNHAQQERDETMKTRYTNPAIHKAFTVLEKLSADEETRYRAEMREEALRNKVSELSAAREEGREEGKEEGRKEGELIGQIRLLQRILKHSIITDEEFEQKSMKELEEMLQELEAKLD
jgi:predicted transposase/invertase (TIGR01784 family)